MVRDRLQSSSCGFAQELAVSGGSGARLFDESFADFSQRQDLPDFDYVGLHGIWSWISAENRSVIVDFLRRKLRVGGILYISYNTQPGWASAIPLRHLLTEHAEVMGASGGGILSRIEAAIEFTERFFATDPAFSRANPTVIERPKQMKSHRCDYLAHEYFNRDWQPMPVAEMAESFAPAKLSFGCSAHLIDHFDNINLTPDQLKFLADIPDPTFRETIRDYMVNQQFRRDYWIKGPRRLSIVERSEALRKQRILLTTRREEVNLKITGMQGELAMAENICTPILDVLADGLPKTIGQVEEAVRGVNVTAGQVLEAVMLIVGKGDISPVQEDSEIAKARKTAAKLNAHIVDKARGNGVIDFLVSPVTGAGISVPRIQQLFLLARRSGHKIPEEWAVFTWQIFSNEGARLVQDGKTLETPDENLKGLTKLAKDFSQNQLPKLETLGIA